MPPRKRTDGVVGTSNEDALTGIIADAINKSGAAQAFSLGDDDAPTDLNMWVSTGSSELDVKISNRKYGGLAFGRIYEFTGLEGSGKSLLAAHIMANVQKDGGLAVLLDTESAVNEDFFNAIGVRLARPHGMYVAVETVEDIFATIEKIIEIVRKNGAKDKKVVIVVDSVAGATTKRELEADYEKSGYNTDKSIILSQAMRKITNLIAREKIMLIFTNQLRHKMNAQPFADPYTTSGGKAIAFHSSVRLRLEQALKIKVNDVIVGVNVKAKIIKNRLGPPHRIASFDVYFDRGIDDITSWYKYLKDSGVIDASGAWAKYVDQHGEEHKFQAKTFPKLLEDNPDLRTELYEKMCDTIITSYKSEGVSTEDDDVVLETDTVEE